MNELIYQILEERHIEGLLNIWGDSDVIKYTNISCPCTLEEVEEKFTILKPFDVFSVIKNGELIGIIGCPPINKEKRQYGLFYQFCKSSWGQGNATVATDWLLNYMKHKYTNVTLFADVMVDNIASEKVLKKFGFEMFSEEQIVRNGIMCKVHNYKLECII